jgi:hypothetical protein
MPCPESVDLQVAYNSKQHACVEFHQCRLVVQAINSPINPSPGFGLAAPARLDERWPNR